MTLEEQFRKAEEKGDIDELTTDIYSWSEEGEHLVGVVVSIGKFTGGKFETEVNQYIIKTDTGLVSTVLGSATDKQLEGIDLKGKLVYIEYRGKVHLEDGRSVNKFNVKVPKHAS